MILRCIAILAVAISTCAAAKPWEACQFVAYSQPQPFYLNCWGDDGKSLYGTFIYHAIPASDRPSVALQISRSYDGPWTPVGRVRATRKVLQNDARGRASRLRAPLEAFRRHLRSHGCGRIVLDTGEVATIDLS